jgi:hypothetical protein
VYVYVCICIGSLRKWYSSFRTRHPHLSDRVSDCVDRKRIEAQHDGESIAHYYELLKAYADWHPSRIYAGDETGLDGDSARRTKILVPKNHKRAHKKGRGYREHTSFLFIADAEGKSLPPIVVHKGERIDAVPPPPDKCNECGSDLKKKRVLPTCTQHASQNIYTTRVD